MAKCFLGYSGAYGHVMERVRKLLTVIGFDVDVFDEPVSVPVGTEIGRRIQAADCAVVLIGPHVRPTETFSGSLQPAGIPVSEADAAHHLGKDVVLVLHNGIHPPVFFSGEVWPHFDFWDNESFLEQYHNITKRLIELKDGIELPWTDANYTFTRGEIINVIESSETLLIVVNHEAIARQPCGVFDHSIDTCGDLTPAAALGAVSATITQTGGEPRKLSIVAKEATDFIYRYNVVAEPRLGSRQAITYRRSFRVHNRFPLSRRGLQMRVEESQNYTYPAEMFGNRYYGDCFEVFAPMHSLKLAIHFPWETRILSHDVIVTDFAGERNERLTQKVRADAEFRDDDTHGRRVLELRVERPTLNHRYYLLYEPGD